MTYIVFGGTLNLAQSNPHTGCSLKKYGSTFIFWPLLCAFCANHLQKYIRQPCINSDPSSVWVFVICCYSVCVCMWLSSLLIVRIHIDAWSIVVWPFKFHILFICNTFILLWISLSLLCMKAECHKPEKLLLAQHQKWAVSKFCAWCHSAAFV